MFSADDLSFVIVLVNVLNVPERGTKYVQTSTVSDVKYLTYLGELSSFPDVVNTGIESFYQNQLEAFHWAEGSLQS